jgi:hypothetical protein
MTATAPSGVVTFLFTDVEGSSLGGRRGSDAGGPAEARRGVAHRDRGARRLCVQPHGRWSGCRILFSEICGRRCDRRAAGGWSCRCGWASRPASRAARRRLLRHGAQSRCAGDGCGARRSDPVAESTAGLLSGVDLVDLGPRRLRDLPTPVGGVSGPSARSANGLSSEWGGPAACTDAMARAMGFGSVRDLFDESERLLAALRTRRPLSRWDWTRTLLATEIVFASDVVGSGVEWTITTGLDDVRTLQALRELQRKLVKARTPVGPRPVL